MYNNSSSYSEGAYDVVELYILKQLATLSGLGSAVVTENSIAQQLASCLR